MIRKLSDGEMLKFTYRNRPVQFTIQNQGKPFETCIEDTETQLYYTQKGRSANTSNRFNYPHPKEKEENEIKRKLTLSIANIQNEIRKMINHQAKASHFLFDQQSNTFSKVSKIDFPDSQEMEFIYQEHNQEKGEILIDMSKPSEILALSIYKRKLFIYQKKAIKVSSTDINDVSQTSPHIATYINLSESSLNKILHPSSTLTLKITEGMGIITW